MRPNASIKNVLHSFDVNWAELAAPTHCDPQSALHARAAARAWGSEVVIADAEVVAARILRLKYDASTAQKYELEVLDAARCLRSTCRLELCKVCPVGAHLLDELRHIPRQAQAVGHDSAAGGLYG